MMDFIMIMFILFLGAVMAIFACVLLANWIADWQD